MQHLKKDESIILLIRNGDPQGLSDLYNKYGDPIFGIILRTVRDKQIAEEIMQETMLKVWDKIHLYEESKSSLFTWLNSVARNTALDKIRLKSFQKQNQLDHFDPKKHDKNINENLNAAIDVKSLISKLEEKYRIILDKLFLEGYSQSEVARELNIPIGTVKTRLRTAVKKLRKELKNEKNLFLGMFILTGTILILCQ